MFDWQPVFLSLKIAFSALLIVTVSGIATAYYLEKVTSSSKDVLEAILTLPLVLPPVVTGFILLLLIGKHGPIGRLLYDYFNVQIIFTPLAATLAACVVAFPLMYQSAKSALQNVDPVLKEAAQTLGAGETKIFFTITMPLAWPGLLSGMVLSFSRALGEFGATIMVAGNIPGKTQTLPTAIYFASESNDLSLAGIYVVIISLLTYSLILWTNLWAKKRRKTIQ